MWAAHLRTPLKVRALQAQRVASDAINLDCNLREQLRYEREDLEDAELSKSVQVVNHLKGAGPEAAIVGQGLIGLAEIS